MKLCIVIDTKTHGSASLHGGIILFLQINELSNLLTFGFIQHPVQRHMNVTSTMKIKAYIQNVQGHVIIINSRKSRRRIYNLHSFNLGGS